MTFVSSLLKDSVFLLAAFLLVTCQTQPGEGSAAGPAAGGDEDLREKARRLAQEIIIVDGHVDIPYRLSSGWENISQRTEGGDFDYPRAREGGLNAPFMAIYVPAAYEERGGAFRFANELIDMVEEFERRWPDKFVLATSVEDIQRHFEEGDISLPMGMENGAPIEGRLENLRHFYDRGIRYITLAHSRSNHISDSSYDRNRRWKGLSPFGKEVVREMNRLGIMVDVSHISDDAFHQVIEVSQAPVIASHSSCRHFTPGWERNMSDDMIRELARNGGVIMISFGSSFLTDSFRRSHERQRSEIARMLAEKRIPAGSADAEKLVTEYRRENPLPFADVSDAADHIDHVVRLVGVDHVGFGSDFDGVGDTLPVGLKDVSDFPNLIYELLKRGYSREEIEKFASGNIFRVWREVERVAREMQEEE